MTLRLSFRPSILAIIRLKVACGDSWPIEAPSNKAQSEGLGAVIGCCKRICWLAG